MRAMSVRKSFMVKHLVRLLAACISGGWALCVLGQTVTVPFSALRATSGEAATAHAWVLELSPREALAGVHLHLALTQAPQPGMRYIAWVNGNRVADVDAHAALQTLALSTPAFEPGVNSIQLALVPGDTRFDARLDADTAHTNAAPVDDARSSLSLDFAGLRSNRAPLLSQLPIAFDRRAWLPRTVTVELAAGGPPAEPLRAAAWAVQAIAAQMLHSDVTVRYRNAGSQDMRDGQARPSSGFTADAARAGDVLLIGTRDALQGKIPPEVERAIAGPFLGVLPADDGKSIVVVISGATASDCLSAAGTFAQALAGESSALPDSTHATVGNAVSTNSSQPRLAVSLANDNPALIQAALNFAAIDARHRGAMTDMDFRVGGRIDSAGLYLGTQATLAHDVLRRLPVFAAPRPGQAVSLRRESPTGASSATPLVTLLGSDASSLARAVELLRDPKVWALFSQTSVLLDPQSGAAFRLSTRPHSWIGTLRLLVASPEVFWPLLGGLLLIAFFSLNSTLKAQTQKRLGLDNR
jgi:hypothetical protein